MQIIVLGYQGKYIEVPSIAFQKTYQREFIAWSTLQLFVAKAWQKTKRQVATTAEGNKRKQAQEYSSRKEILGVATAAVAVVVVLVAGVTEATIKSGIKNRMGCGSSAEGPVTARQLAKGGMALEDWVAIVSRVKGIVGEQEVKKMLLWFNSNFRGGVTADEFRWYQKPSMSNEYLRKLFRTFFPKTATGANLSDLVFRF